MVRSNDLKAWTASSDDLVWICPPSELIRTNLNRTECLEPGHFCFQEIFELPHWYWTIPVGWDRPSGALSKEANEQHRPAGESKHHNNTKRQARRVKATVRSILYLSGQAKLASLHDTVGLKGHQGFRPQRSHLPTNLIPSTLYAHPTFLSI